MSATYSNWKASRAIAKASLISMLRSPTAVVFSLLFPIIFIVVFGSMVDNGGGRIRVAFTNDCDTTNIIYKVVSGLNIIRPQTGLTPGAMHTALEKGQITAIIRISNDAPGGILPHFLIQLTTAHAASDKFALLQTVIEEAIHRINDRIFTKNLSAGTISVVTIPGRSYHQIDFILPGQLGFSLLMAGVFSSAFLFFNLRQGFVLKRIFATPIRRTWLILGELISRLMFQVIGFVVMMALGHFAFQFTLVNGLATFFEMLAFSLLGLLIFMGTGFIISSLIHDEGSLAPVANTVTLPQILLCGLFFSIESYPHWLQAICNILPLTMLVNGLRKIAFEGTHIWQMPDILAGLAAWTIGIGFITIRVFRWE